MHVRTMIRNAFRHLLETGLPSVGYEVLGTRTTRRNRTQGDALIDVRFTEITVEQNTMGDMRTHRANLVILVQHEGPEETLHDLLDADEVLITKLVDDFSWSRLLEEKPELVQITFAQDGESDAAVGVISLRYAVEYRISKFDPETVRA